MIGLVAGVAMATMQGGPFDVLGRTDPQKEIEMGRAAYDEVLRSGRLSRDPQANNRVQRVLANLLGAMPRREYPYQVVLVGDNQINAYCLPGGYMAVHLGILSLMHNDEELAAVLSHEIGHAARRHWARLTRKSASDFVADLMLGTQTSGVRFYSYKREHETEADEFGAMLYVAAGYPPAKASSGMKLILSTEGPDSTPYYARTHPFTRDRIRNIDRIAAAAPRPKPREATPIDALALLGDVPAGTAVHPLLPLETERRWTYRVEAAGVRQEYTVEVVGLAQGETCRVARLRCDAGGDWTSYQCATTGTAMYRRDRPDRETSRWKPVLSTAGGELGGWTYESPVEEATSVPAGEYPHAMKIVGRRDGRETVWWLVDGVGIVRKEDRPAGGTGATSEVLLSTSR